MYICPPGFSDVSLEDISLLAQIFFTNKVFKKIVNKIYFKIYIDLMLDDFNSN